MVAKKSESNKYVRVAFTMEPELHLSVIEKVKAEKATLSGVISSLLSEWTSRGSLSPNGENVSFPCVDDTSIQEMMGRIKALEDAVSALTSTDKNQYESVNNSHNVVDSPELTERKISNESVQPSIIEVEEALDIIPPSDSENTNILHPVDDSSQETQNNPDIQQVISLDPEGWYTQSQVKDRIDSNVPRNTRKGWVSKAVASGSLVTNGEKGKECRIKGASAIEWLEKIPTHI